MVLTSIFTAFALAQTPTPLTTTSVQGLSLKPALFGQSAKRVSLKFNDASLKDVLNRLQKEKIDFAVDADAFKDRKITLNLTDVPLSTALSAIADALGAHWENVGSVQVLKKGPGMNLRSNFGSVFEGQGIRSFTMPKLDGQFKTLDGLAFSKDAQANALKALENARKELADQKGMSDVQRQDALKALENARKSLADQKFEFKAFAAPKFDLKGFSMPKDGTTYKSLSPQESEEFRKAMERIRGTQKDTFSRTYTMRGLNTQGLFFKSQNLGDLLKSLTADQKELQKKQGYLKISDLTPEQRKMAGLDGDGKGKVEITITRDGETLKIKGE